jgi:hypothetical protein
MRHVTLRTLIGLRLDSSRLDFSIADLRRFLDKREAIHDGPAFELLP